MKISSYLKFNTIYFVMFFALFIFINLSFGVTTVHADPQKHEKNNSDKKISKDALMMIDKGRKTFRYDTFGDEFFWGDGIGLHCIWQLPATVLVG